MSVLVRQAIRAMVLSPDRCILLMKIRNPVSRKEWWICPGGGMQEGETVEQALVRELREELGLEGFTQGPLLHRRHHTFDWKGQRISQHERFHVVETARFEPVISDSVEAEVLQAFRWWSVPELRETREAITPRALPDILERYWHAGAPREELVVETLVD